MIKIQPIGDVDRKVLNFLKDKLSDLFGDVKVLHAIAVPGECYNSVRNQYNSTCILKRLKPIRVTLGVTEVDLYAGFLNFVFGEAELNGSRAVISLYRLRYNADIDLLKIRALKEAVHEIGHVLGLEHCTNRRCVMSFSNSVFEVDVKSHEFCERCLKKLGGL